MIVYNLLNFPAGVVPVSTVTAEDEEKLKHYKGNYQDYWDKVFKQVRKGRGRGERQGEVTDASKSSAQILAVSNC